MWKIATILISGFLLRIIGINWDLGIHLHPDERALMMTTSSLNFFDKLNPHLFNYGSLPIYLLKGFGQIIDFFLNTHFATYGQMLYLGRFLSTLADIGTIFLIYKISRLLFKNKKIAIFSSFLYSIAFFPIQNSHFFIADTFLTFFLTFTLYRLLIYSSKPTNRNLIIVAAVYSASITSKFTAILFIPVILTIILLKSKEKIKKSIFFLLFLFLFSFIFMPFMFIDYQNFVRDVSSQLRLNNNAYTFPYTLQYVNTMPYIYYLKNIFIWGLGPILSILSIFGIFLIIKFIKKKKEFNADNLLLFSVFYLFYFLVIGRSAVKFMRYMLPFYPFLIIMAGFGLYYLNRSKKLYFKYSAYIFSFLILFWTFMFMNIFLQEHTRITASKWINKNIPDGSVIATEHWDDYIPLFGGEKYKHEELTLYDQPDNDIKWNLINERLKNSDYIIIASNRLSTPLQRLSDCQKYKACYPKTSEYYQKLFNNKLSFKKVVEFSVYPKLNIGNLKFEINDDAADESFTVYDHPKIMIFKKK